MTLRRLKLACLSVWLLLFTGGLVGHPGSLTPYLAFTVVLTAVLVNGLYRPISYGYLFLSVFFWLGFWLKLVIHNIFQYDYVEPIGRFDGSVTAWDEALLVPTVSGLGVLLARWLYSFWYPRTTLEFSLDGSRVPLWYPVWRRHIWLALIVFVFSLNAFNSLYGIQQIGLAPKTILIWPLNALISWLLSTGLSMALATVLWWDICLKRDISWSIYTFFAEAFVSTISLLSRGIFFFHTAPPLLALLLNRSKLIWSAQKKFFLAIAVLSIFFLVSLAVVSTLRGYLFYSSHDFRTETQNISTRIRVLQSVPSYEERYYLKSINRLKELEVLIPMLENITISTFPSEAKFTEFHQQLKQYESFSRSSSVKEIERLKKYEVWLKQNIPQMRKEADLAKQRNPALQSVTPRELWLEDHYLYLVRERAQLERQLAERTSEASAALRTPFGKATLLMDELGYQLTTGLAKHGLALGVDRWIGMEGVLATVAYSEKGFDRFLQAAQEKLKDSQVSLYQTISQSLYQQTDANKYRFASLPGATAFFYFSGSLVLVFFGLLGVAVITILAEKVTDVLTSNKLLCALVGMNFANAAAQLGVGSSQLIIHFGMIFFMIFFVALIQSNRLKIYRWI